MNLGELLQANVATDTFRSDAAKRNIAAQASALANAHMHNNALTAAINQGIGTYSTSQPQDIPEFNPNTAPAFQCTLEALCDLWRAKHGDRWVLSGRAARAYATKLRDADETFWDDARDRLGSAGMLESHRGWLRLKG